MARPPLESRTEDKNADRQDSEVGSNSLSNRGLPAQAPPSDSVVQEALTEFRQYLSDTLAPSQVADSLTVLVQVPPHQVAAEIATWAADQRVAEGLTLTDHYVQGLRKLQVVGALRLVPPFLFEPFFERLQATILEGVPRSDRDRLAADLARLSESHTVPVEHVEVRPSPAGAGEAPRGAAAEGAWEGVRLNMPPGFELTPRALRRLEVLLGRLGRLAPSTARQRRDLVVAEAFATVAAGVSSTQEMDAQLEQFRSAGLAPDTYELFRALGEGLPGGWAPGLPRTGETAAPGLAAMERLITLARDPVEASRRFREMIESAIEQFNAGALGRAVRVFDLALEMIDGGTIAAQGVESLRERGHEALDPDYTVELAKEGSPQAFPQAILRFFRALSPDRLLDELQRERRRERRQTLLALIESHGDVGREAVFERLVDRCGDLDEVYFFRNLIHLLRRIPRSVKTMWPEEHELEQIVRCLTPERPVLLIKEIVTYLSSAEHAAAHEALRGFLARLEAVATSPDTPDEERVHIRFGLDATCRALAACDDPQAWATLLTHAMRPDANPIDARRRLNGLGRRDLSAAPELVNRLIDAALQEVGRCARQEETPERGAVLGGIVSALASTRTPQVRALLETVAKRLPGDQVGQEAARWLREIEPSPGPGVVPEGRVLGTLGLFALPALLQSLAHRRSTGTVTFARQDEERVARVTLEDGRMTAAEAGDLRGREAVWQLIERPFTGQFVFGPDRGGSSLHAGEALDVAPLLLEGMRRNDELRLAEALVSGDVTLVPRIKNPPHVPGEDDEVLVRKIWKVVAAGRTVTECEQALAVDAFRVWRAVASWIEADVLESAGAAQGAAAEPAVAAGAPSLQR